MPRDDSALLLEDQLCFALYAASRAMISRYRPALDEIGVTYPQYLVMIVLWDDGPSTVSELGERLRLDSGTLSPLLKRLETNGFITRARREDDERSVRISLTRAGIMLRDEAGAAQAKVAALLGDLDHHELTTVLHDLEGRLREA